MNKVILFTVISIFFPVYLKYSGINLIQVSVFLSFLSFSFFSLKYGVIRQRKTKYFYVPAFSLLIIGFFSVVTNVNGYFVESLRSYLSFCGAILLFLVIVNYINVQEAEKRFISIHKLFKIIFTLISFDVINGLILFIFPKYARFLEIITLQSSNTIQIRNQGMERITGLVLTPESAGELNAMIIPLVLAFYFLTRKKIYLVFFFIFVLGLTFSATRSAYILFIVGILFWGILNKKILRFSSVSFVILLVGLIILLVMAIFPGIFVELIDRLDESFSLYMKYGLTLETMNRSFFEEFYPIIMEKLSFFGNGMTTIINDRIVNIHNMYLTTLHRLGIMGFLALFLLFLKIIFSLMKNYLKKEYDKNDKLLLSSMLISVIIFFINEFKYEFLRSTSYQQLIFLLLSLYFVSSKTIQDNLEAKNI